MNQAVAIQAFAAQKTPKKGNKLRYLAQSTMNSLTWPNYGYLRNAEEQFTTNDL